MASYKKLLRLTSADLTRMSEGQLREAIKILNDVANKRVKRIEEAGLTERSAGYQALIESGKTRFTLERGSIPRKDLKSSFSQVRNYLREYQTSSVRQIKKYTKNIADKLDSILKKAKEIPTNLDRRYKEPTLRKKVEKELKKDFWEEYNKWKEVQQKKNPPKYAQGSPVEYVGEFYDEYYSKGETNLSDYEKGAIEEYEKTTQGEEPISSGEDEPKRTKPIIQTKYSKKRKSKEGFTERFGSIKVNIF